MEKILIVDDDQSICEILEFNLKSEGYTILTAHSAEEGLSLLTPDCNLILLDVMMGGVSGYKMAEKLRQDKNAIPIIFLTAKDTENDMLTGFSVGGDDYIAKPFSIKEVSARIKAVLSRVQPDEASLEASAITSIQLGSLSIDTTVKEARIDDLLINLTPTEYGILVLLAGNTQRVFSRIDIMDSVWREDTFVTDRTVDVHITRLRKKMGTYGAAIVNRFGFGYRFDDSKL